MKNNPLRAVWRSMKSRCYNPKSERFYCYGARGIEVCQEWHNPETFIQWALSKGWREGLQIDRIDNDGNYTPENCRFVTREVNANNKRTTVKITYEDVTMPVQHWGEKFNIPGKIILQRIARGWSVKDALTVKSTTDKNKPIICLNNGKRYDSIQLAAKELNVFESNIGKVARKERQSTGGYSFEFV